MRLVMKLSAVLAVLRDWGRGHGPGRAGRSQAGAASQRQ